NVGQSITINGSDTIVLGMGIATLTAVNGAVPLVIGDAKGVAVAGIMIDAGTVNSPALLTIGKPRTAGSPQTNTCTDPADPTTLSDVFMRIGVARAGTAHLDHVS